MGKDRGEGPPEVERKSSSHWQQSLALAAEDGFQ